MDLHIPDEILKSANLTPETFRLEAACRLFDAEVLAMREARLLSGLSRPAFENELVRRGIAVYRPRLDDVLQELAEIREEWRLRRGGAAA